MIDHKSSFKELYSRLGLVEYPFTIYTTENEKDKLEQLFIQPSDYAPIIESFNHDRTMMLVGNRGTGKTALLYDLLRKENAELSLICSIDNFSELSTKVELREFYTLILKALTSSVFLSLAHYKSKLNKLGKEEKLLLSYLLKNYIESVTKRNLRDKIEQVQTRKLLRSTKKVYNFFRFTLNYGATAATNFISDTITSHFSKLPPLIQEGKVKEFFPELSTGIDDGFLDIDATYSLIERFINIIKKMGYKKVIITFDKLDEDPRFENDAEGISEFIKPVVTDNKLLLNQEVQLIISVWAVPFALIRDTVRTQKHYCPEITWNDSDLTNALNQRLKTYSNDKITDFTKIFAPNINPTTMKELFKLANSNPRDLWHIINRIFEAQYEIDSEANFLSEEAIVKGFTNFVLKFNFYEYYPKRINARSNTMDVYSYVAHLQKLSNEVFTKNQLNERAGTGSSTNNYVIAMEKMGLIKKDGQQSGAVTYKINDPKVIFAINHGLQIERR
ncbi:P-loop ATPase, Sll1717 family [Paenibacillus wulumuqiensis]|uniref:P-loop ATPase, Sll1717 family n=1 Tax=Paenibacillus wulumuqiensis TaxID=1567107 RepID=UPI0006196AD4|nr:ATP-binding protein [Paenibacillus wulumuqiensis]